MKDLSEFDFLYETDPQIKRLEFHLVTVCSSRCVFCSEAFRMQAFRNEGFSPKEAIYILSRYAKQGFEHLNITGGEPTLYPQLRQVLHAAKKLGFRTYIATNGIKTRHKEYLSSIAPFLDELCVSLHGADASTHEKLTGRKDSFNHIMQTVENVQSIGGIRLFVNTVAVKPNQHELVRIHEMASNMGALAHLISNLAPEGLGLVNFYDLSIPDDDWPTLAEALLEASQAGSTVLRFFGVPICLLGNAYTHSNDLYFDPRLTVERIRMPDGSLGWCAVRSFNPVRERIYTYKCKGCAYEHICGGFVKKP